MGRADLRERARMEKQIARELAKKPMQWEELTPSQIHNICASAGLTQVPFRVVKNHLYSVQVFNRETEWGLFYKAMIRRHDSEPIHNWKEIQKIKSEVFGPDYTALEVYPKESNKVDVANLYWIWVMADGRDCPIESRRDRIL